MSPLPSLLVLLVIGAPAMATPPWRDPAPAELARKATAERDAASQREKAAAALIAAAERALERERSLTASEAQRVATLEAQIPALESALAERDAANGEVRARYREALSAARVAKKAGGRAARSAEAKVEETRAAWQEARRTAWRASGALTSATRALEQAKEQHKLAERRLAAAEAALERATKARDEATARRGQAELWVEATRALAAGELPAALAAADRLGSAAPGSEPDRAYLRCVAMSGDEEARVRACDLAAGARPSAHRYLALALLSAGRADRIDEALERVRRARPADDDAELRVAAGVALVAAKRHAEAVPLLEQALRGTGLGAQDAVALDALAVAHAALGHHGPALVALDQLAAVDPARPGLAYRRALLYAEKGEDEKASALMESFVGPTRKGAQDLSYAACQRDLYRDVVPPHGIVLPPEPNPALGHVFLGLQAAQAGDLARADEHFAQALELAPDDLEVRLQVGLFRLRSGAPQAAEEHLARVVAAGGEGSGAAARARVALAVTLSLLSRPQEAIALLEKAPAEEPLAQLALGVALARAGEHDRARVALNAAQGAPEHAREARHDLAALAYYTGAGVPSEPAEDGTPAAWPEEHLLRALVTLDAGGDAAPAIAHLTEALAQKPGYLQARMALGRALDQVGRGADAITELRRAVAIDPSCPEAHAQLGAVLGRSGQGEAAAAEYGKAETLREARKKRRAELADARAGTDGAPRDPGPKRIAVVQFINATQAAQWEWLSFGIAEALSTDLAQLSSLEVVERGQVATLMREIKFASMDFVDAKTAPKIGQVLGVEALVVGSYQVADGKIRIDGRLVELGSQRVLRSGQTSGSLDDLFALERALSLELVGGWAKVDDVEKKALISAPSGSVSGLEQLALTRQKMLAGDAVGAKNAYREAVKRSPELARQIKDLRGAYEDAEARLAVLPFKNVSGDPESDWIGVGIAESMATDLRKIGLYVVERGEIAKVMTEQKFGLIVEPERAARLGLTVGAQTILLGSYQTVGDLLAIDARMVQVETGAVVLTERVSGKASEFFELQRRLSASIARGLDQQLSVEELAALSGETPNLEDFKQTILKDRLFVLRQPSAAHGDDAGPGLAPIIVGLGGLGAGIAGGVLFGLGEGRHSASDRELALYRRAVAPDEIETRYRRARELDDDGNALQIGSYVLFGLAGAAAVYTTWALIDEAGSEPETHKRVEVVRPGIAPTIGPGGVGLEMRMGF